MHRVSLASAVLRTGVGAFLVALVAGSVPPRQAQAGEVVPPEIVPVQRLLYVAVPGVRNLLEYGGHGLLVFAIDDEHRFVRRIPTAGRDAQGKPLNVKGLCASGANARIYISTLEFVTCLDLRTDEVLWERAYPGGCDRPAIAPDGSQLYVPSLEGPHWHAIDGDTGEVLDKIVPDSGAHNTVWGADGRRVYLAGLKSPWLSVADPERHEIIQRIGPFSASIRPFTVDGRQERCYVNLNELLGFEIGNLKTGEKLCRVEVAGFKTGQPKRHGCPSHGIALTPDEGEIWVTDAVNRRLHVFDNTQFPPTQVASIELRDEPGWVTFSIQGDYAYPSTGEVIDAATRKIVATLTDETGAAVQSEKMLEIDVKGNEPVANGDQFGVGRRTRQ